MCTDAELTEMCRIIFGDIVARAYFRPEDLKYQDPDIIMQFPLYMNWGTETFVVEYTNGATVVFNNSEWAYLERIDK